MLDALIPLCARQPWPGAANDRNRLINHVAGRGDIALLKALVAAGFSIDAGPPAGFQERDPYEESGAGPYRPLDPFNSASRKATATTLLHAAAAKGDIGAAEFLLKLGAGINRAGGPWEVTPIYCND